MRGRAVTTRFICCNLLEYRSLTRQIDPAAAQLIGLIFLFFEVLHEFKEPSPNIFARLTSKIDIKEHLCRNYDETIKGRFRLVGVSIKRNFNALHWMLEKLQKFVFLLLSECKLKRVMGNKSCKMENSYLLSIHFSWKSGEYWIHCRRVTCSLSVGVKNGQKTKTSETASYLRDENFLRRFE